MLSTWDIPLKKAEEDIRMKFGKSKGALASVNARKSGLFTVCKREQILPPIL